MEQASDGWKLTSSNGKVVDWDDGLKLTGERLKWTGFA